MVKQRLLDRDRAKRQMTWKKKRQKEILDLHNSLIEKESLKKKEKSQAEPRKMTLSDYADTSTILIYTDGSSNNKYGYLCDTLKWCKIIQEPVKTSNVAEYMAILEVMTRLANMPQDKLKKPITILSDSELAVNQLNLIYRTTEPELRKLVIQIWQLEKHIQQPVKFVWIPRELNKIGKLL